VRPTANVAVFQQGVSGYAGAVDTMLAQSRPTGGFAAAAVAWSGSAVGQQQVALLRFDGLFGAASGQIPAGATIDSARLVLTTPASIAGAAGGGGTLLRLKKPFAAGATWASALGGNGVQPDGIEAEVVADRVIGSVAEGVCSFDVTASVQAWAGGAANQGWAIRGGSTDAWGIATAEAVAVGERPRLVVTWRPAAVRSAPAGATRLPFDAAVLAAAFATLVGETKPRPRRLNAF
jgi:hypothetical protein